MNKRHRSQRAAKTKGNKKTPVWKTLSAGLITGAADDDPSGIATYSQVGAAHGFNILWTVLLCLPLMIGIQMISARIGRTTGVGIGRNVRRQYGAALACGLAGILLVANVINLGADVGAMGAALKLLVGGPAFAYTAGFALLSLGLQMYVPFSWYSPVLKVLTLSLFAYVAAVFAIHVSWGDVAKATLIPHFEVSSTFAMAIVAVLGTTISPYLFFWQAAQEVEELRSKDNDRKPLIDRPLQGSEAMKRIGIDTVSGMVVSEIVAFFIILTTAAVLHMHGRTNISSAAEAAAALKPIAGPFASAVFAAGIIGTGLLGVPILAGSAAYGAADALNKRTGLERSPNEAKFFYSVLAAAFFGGLTLNLTPIDPIKALYWSAVINGVAAAPIMVMVMLLGRNKRAMKEFTLPGWLSSLGWLATIAMVAAAIILFATLGK
jgi:NRAMP (natural resistance-associated macrophage protein)-like metal ion transporter